MINIVAFTKTSFNSHTPNYSCCVPQPFPSPSVHQFYILYAINIIFEWFLQQWMSQRNWIGLILK